MMGRLVKTFRFVSPTQPYHYRHKAPTGVGQAAIARLTNHADQESAVPDAANAKWFPALEVFSSSGELGQGKMSMTRMTHLIDVGGTLVLVVGSALAKDIVEQACAPISAVITQIWGRSMPMEVTVDTPSGVSRAPMPPVAPEPVNLTTVAPASTFSPPPSVPPQPSGPSIVPAAPAAPTVPTRDEQLAEPSPCPATVPSSTPHSQVSATSALPTMSGSLPDRSGLPGTYNPRGTGPQSSTGLPTPTIAHDVSQLNPRYIFDTYVAGSSNRFVCATALAMAEAPARTYNSLSTHGGSGLGKTHLLHAIGHYAQTPSPGIRIKYVNPEVFVSSFIACTCDGNQDDGRMEGSKRRYHEIDILLVDDIQFFQSKGSTLKKFSRISDPLHSSDKQVILIFDQPLKTPGGLDGRLRSRFEWGLLVGVQPPDLEARVVILFHKGTVEGLDLLFDVLKYITSRITTNTHELEGVLIRMMAFASSNKQPVDQTLAEMVLRNIISDPEGQEIMTSPIMTQTVSYFSVIIDDLRSADRSRTMVSARHIAMYLCRELIDLSLPKIGREFGGCDRTTVTNMNKKIRTLMTERRSTFNQVTELTNCIKQAARSPARPDEDAHHLRDRQMWSGEGARRRGQDWRERREE